MDNIKMYDYNRVEHLKFPFQYFHDLQQEHKKIIESLRDRLVEVQKISKDLIANQFDHKGQKETNEFEQSSPITQVFKISQLIY